MLRINITRTKRVMSEMGIALSLVSIPLGMIVKVIWGNMIFGNLLMALGLLMMFPYHRMRDGIRLNLQSGVMIFVILSFVYYIFSDFDEPVYLLYLGVTLFFSVGLSLSKYGKDFSLDNTIRYIWLFSLVSVLGGLYCFVSGKLSFLSGLLDFNEEGDTIYDGLTMGSVCIMQIICSFYFISKADNSLLERYLMFLLIILDFVMTLMAFKRTPLLIALVIIFYYLRRLGYLALTPRKVICFILVFLAIMVYVISNSELSEAVATISENTFEGISSLVTGDHTGHSLTNSTDVRIENRDAAFGMIAHFDVLEYMIGRGFMTFWFDMPLVQSYLDMGVIGLVLFAFYTVYLPLYSVFSKIRKNRIVLLCGMFAFPGAVCCLTNGHPYFQSLWMPVSLLCFVLDEDWKIQGKKE